MTPPRGRASGGSELNEAGKDLEIAVAAIEVDCTSSGCVSIYRDVEPCDCLDGAARYGPMAGSEQPLVIYQVERFTPVSSLMLGGEGVRFRVTACTTD